MLEPQSQHLFMNALRPPDGFHLDQAIGTTFSLDLIALLSVPLAFTFSNWEDREGNPTANPLALLEAVKRNAERISIFHQAGQISVPNRQERLFAYLEKSVHPVRGKKEFGIFHPKVWILRYVKRQGSSVEYRFICLSRNLTFDRSWDTILVLDGNLTDRTNAIAVNHPLGEFVKILPELAIHPLPKETQERIRVLQDEVRRVQFRPPEGFDEYRFLPIGITDKPEWPFPENHRRMLIVSPFLGDGLLKRITNGRPDCLLISRDDEAEKLTPETIQRFRSIYTLSQEASPEQGEEGEEENSDFLSGLHAKLYLMDDGWNSRLWTGSANATNAAFPDPHKPEDRAKGNVEFLVELIGLKSRFGIDSFLRQETGTISFRDLLKEFVPPVVPPVTDAHQQMLDDEVRSVRRRLATAGLAAIVVSAPEENGYNVEVQCLRDTPSLPPDMQIKCWPVTFKEHLAVRCRFDAPIIACFDRVTLDTLTEFLVFDLSLSRDGRKSSSRFVIQVPLKGEPEGRFARLLRILLENKSQVLRLLLMLLADHEIGPGDGGNGGRVLFGEDGTGSGGLPEIPLLESLLRALDRQPEKIDRVSRFVDDLSKDPEGASLLPDGFLAIWPAIREARERWR